ncbi:uncharacterized protein LOC115531143 isoform X2 [Gadus morhua]|nr:uncharacterized protein LOC115531143 isoform X2 [Gadus morhua]
MFQKMRKQRTLTDLLEEAEGAISDPFRPKKQQIHPELPKRPPLAHTLYLKEHLELYKKQHPDLEHKQLIARLSACYKKLPARVKVKYVKKYNLSRDQYDKEMIRLRRQYGKPFQPMSNTGHYSALKRKLEEQDDLDAETSPTSSGPSRKRGIVELPNQPPVNGFQLLVAEQRVASGPMAPRDHLRASSLRWRSLRQAERDGYNTRANGLKQRYGATLNAFLSNLTKEQKEILKEDLEMLFRTAKKYSKIKPLLFDGEPKKPSCAGASVFCSQKMRCLIGDFRDHREKFSWINSKWKTLSTEQKAPFCKEAETRFHRYTLDLQDWFRNLSPETKAEYLNQKPRNMEYVTLDLEKPVKKERHMASVSKHDQQHHFYTTPAPFYTTSTILLEHGYTTSTPPHPTSISSWTLRMKNIWTAPQTSLLRPMRKRTRKMKRRSGHMRSLQSQHASQLSSATGQVQTLIKTETIEPQRPMLNGAGARRTKRPSHVRPPTPTSKWYHLTSSTSHVGLLTLTYPRYHLTPTTSHVGLFTLTYPRYYLTPTTSHVGLLTLTYPWYYLTPTTSHVGLLTLTYPRYYLTSSTSHVVLLTLTYPSPSGIISPPPLWGLAPNVYYLER